MRQRIITTCGDANVMVGTKHIDPALCLYVGAHLICIDNKHLKDKVPRGNGTMCRVIGLKLKQNPTTYAWKNYYGRKVWTVNARDVEWVECEHMNKPRTIVQLEAQIYHLKILQKEDKNNLRQLESTIQTLTSKLLQEMISQKFNLKPESFSTQLSVKTFLTSKRKKEYRCKMTQIPANSYDASTGHKLQGMSKDAIIVTSWPTGFRNWEYVVLSRVRTLSGLYLIKPIDMEKSFQPSKELQKYIEYAKAEERKLLNNREKNMSQFTWM